MISIIIPSYKRPAIIQGTLFALSYQTYFKKNQGTILVSLDDSDPTLEKYKSYIFQINKIYKDKNINLVISLIINETKGLVHAKNSAIAKAKDELIFMIDDDLYMEDNYIEQLVKLMSHPSVGAASGFIISSVPAISHTQPSSYITKIPKNKLLQSLKIEKQNDQWRTLFGKKEQVMDWSKIRSTIPSNITYEMQYFVNSYIFKKSIWQEIKGYNPRLNNKTSAHEEVEFTFRIHKQGYKLLFSPHIKMWHLTVGEGGIYKGKNLEQSKKILEQEYQDSIEEFISKVS